MKILLVISKFLPEYTGAAHRLNKLYQLLSSDFNFSVLCGGIENKTHCIYTHGQLNVERLPDLSSGIKNRWVRTLYFYLDFLITWRALHKKKFDVLHIAGTSAQTCAALYYARNHNIPTVIELVTSGAHPLQPLPFLGKFFKHYLPEKAIIIAISGPLRQRCLAYGYQNICWSRPNPIDEEKFQPLPDSKATLRSEVFPFSAADTVITMIAKFMPQKNQIFLLDVLALLPENYKLALGGPVTGNGPLADRDRTYMAQLESRIGVLGLTDRVFIQPNFINEPQKWMQASDIYALPNRDEGLGTPLLEAQACGISVVANTDEAAFHDWVDQGKSGFLVPLEPMAWAETIQKCTSLQPEELIARAMHIRSHYGLKKVAQTYHGIFTYLHNNNSALSLTEVLNAPL